MKPGYVVFYSVKKIFLLLRKFRARFFTRIQALQIINFVFPFGAPKGVELPGCSPNSKAKIKNTNFVGTVISKVSPIYDSA
jgi:hypothetical protein